MFPKMLAVASLQLLTLLLLGATCAWAYDAFAGQTWKLVGVVSVAVLNAALLGFCTATVALRDLFGWNVDVLKALRV